MTIERCHRDDLYESPARKKKLKPGDIVTDNTYASGARIRRGTLISIVGNDLVVDWWDMTEKEPMRSPWDGSAAGIIAEASRRVLFGQNLPVRGQDAIDTLNDYVNDKLRDNGHHVTAACTEVSNNMTLGGMSISLRFVVRDSHSQADVYVDIDQHGLISKVRTGPVEEQFLPDMLSRMIR